MTSTRRSVAGCRGRAGRLASVTARCTAACRRLSRGPRACQPRRPDPGGGRGPARLTSGMKSRVQPGRRLPCAEVTHCCEVGVDDHGGVADVTPRPDERVSSGGQPRLTPRAVPATVGGGGVRSNHAGPAARRAQAREAACVRPLRRRLRALNRSLGLPFCALSHLPVRSRRHAYRSARPSLCPSRRRHCLLGRRHGAQQAGTGPGHRSRCPARRGARREQHFRPRSCSLERAPNTGR